MGKVKVVVFVFLSLIWMEIVGKYVEMSIKSLKLNWYKVSLKFWGIEVKYVLDCF